MRRFFNILLIAAMLLSSSVALAIPADPTPKQIRQKDGTTITVITYGDEFYHYTTTSDGYLIKSVDGIYQYATVDAEGRITALGVNAKNPSLRTSVDNTALAKASRGVPMQIFDKVHKERRAEKAVDSPFTLDKMKSEGGQSRASVKQEKVIVLLAQYTDVKFTTPNANQAFHDMLNQEGYSKNGATGSARDYYYENSYGLYDLQLDVVGPYTMPHNMAYYGGGDADARADQLIIDVCKAADAEVDFTEYATDGYITRLFVYFAGHNPAESGPVDNIWPHRSIVASAPSFDGVKLYDYACSSELKGASGTTMTSIGTFCHEYAHCIGLADYYNTAGLTGTVNLGSLSLMNSGNYNNNSATPPELSAYDKSFLGWLDLKPLPASGSLTMKPLNEQVGYYIPTSVDGEYFVFENRDMTYKWNRYINNNNVTGGLLVYHVDESSNFIAEAGTTARQLWLTNQPNVYAQHECFKVVRAEKVSATSPYLWFYPGRNNHTTLSSTNNTEFRAWSGDHTGYTLEDISLDGKNITFDIVTMDASLTAMVYDANNRPVADATVTLIEESVAKSAPNQLLPLSPTTRALTGYYSYTTNNNGKAVLDVPTGNYKLIIGKEGVGFYTDDITVYPGNSTRNFTLGNINVGSEQSIYNYADNPALVLTNVDKNYLYGVKFTFDDIDEGTSNKRILSSIIAPNNQSVKVAIKLNSDKAIIKEYTANNQGMVDLSGQNIIIGSGDEVIVGINNFSGRLDIDGNPESGRNLISNDGENWSPQNFTGYGNVAWDISVSFADYKDDATSMSITSKEFNLSVGEVEQLKYSFSPAGTVGNPVWKSSNEDVAVVDAGGILRIVGAGNATITATLNGKAATGSVSVNAAAEVELGEPELTNINGKWSAKISWTPKQSRSNWVLYYKSNVEKNYTRKDFAGSVTNYTIANLMEGAEYEIHLSSKHTYLADEIWGAQSKKFVVDGELIEPEDIVISGHKESMSVDETVQLTAKVMPEGTYDREVTWSVAPSNLATISNSGVLTALSGGEVTVTATSAIKKVSASVKINIKNAVADIAVEPYQNDVIITWSGKHESWAVEFKENKAGGLNKKTTVTEPMFHIDCLKPGADYMATITPIVDGKPVTDRAQTVNIKTLANVHSYASITAKGNYSAGDIIPLRVADIQGTLESVTWYVDGQKVTPPTIKLSAGRHKIEAVVKTMLNSEKLIKFVTIK